MFLVTIINHIGFAVENARLYDEARHLTLTLEEKVVEKTRELEEAHLQILQAEKLGAVGQFVSSVAHELNNPLASIIGYAELLKLDLTEKKYDGQVNKVLVEASRCVEIVRRLLAYSHQSQIPKKETANIKDLIADALETEGIKLTENNVKVHLDLAVDLPLVWIERGSIHQVLVNLIDNAVAAMIKKGGDHIIELKSYVQDGRVFIECSDNGPGIPPDIIDDIFKPFFTTKETGKGIGLGLAICSEIVERNGGVLWAESVYGDGATFYLSLPLSDNQEEEEKNDEPSHADETARTAKMRILVIDDEETMSDFVSQALSRAGHQVDVAYEGEEGLAKIEKTEYDLILSDIKMTGLNGMLFFQILKKDKPHMADRIIFMTGALLEKEIEEFLNTNQLPVLRKPFYMNQLLQAVNKIGQGADKS
jgi:signal transduction histidine kinase/ActR/RegA family two-component response regulator